MQFDLLSIQSGSEARRGVLQNHRGVVQTPAFMPVGTLGLVKALQPADLDTLGASITLANAYHLMLRPGEDLVRDAGGIQKFAGRSNGLVLTDSGGFQVFSLAAMRKITDEGVTFRSHIDGSLHHLTPKRLVDVQEALGSDIAMVIDECPPGAAARDVVGSAVARTTRWAKGCIEHRSRDDVAWFGIVQGGVHEDIRLQHAAVMSELPFDGLAIGGVSVGESRADIDRIVRATAKMLPTHKPRYLMGVGTPEDLIRGVDAGVDMFDCVLPSRNARNGQMFIPGGTIQIKNAIHRRDFGPVDKNCPCEGCQTVSRAFLRHLYIAGELSYHRFATIHNLTYIMRLMADIRSAIEAGEFVREEFLGRYVGVPTPPLL